MKALVVYESLWGNTEAVAKEVARGIGQDARAVTPDGVTRQDLDELDLLVAGAPVLGFGLGGKKMHEGIARDEANAPVPPDLSHPSLRTWLEQLPTGHAAAAAFETRIWWSPRGATGDIEGFLSRAGYRPVAPAAKFVVRDKYGPLREGELERARRWGKALAEAVK